MEQYIVYVRINSEGCIIAVNSSAFLSDTTGWTAIDEGCGDKYHHAQGNYFSQSLYTDGGACRYKLADGVPVACSEEEIAQQEAANQSGPALEERIAALEEENAMLLDCLLEMSEVIYA